MQVKDNDRGGNERSKVSGSEDIENNNGWNGKCRKEKNERKKKQLEPQWQWQRQRQQQQTAQTEVYKQKLKQSK